MDVDDVPDWIYEPLFSPDTEEHTVEYTGSPGSDQNQDQRGMEESSTDPSLSHELDMLEPWVNDVEAMAPDAHTTHMATNARITKEDIGLYTQIMEPIQSRTEHRETTPGRRQPLLDAEDLVRSLLVPSSSENVDDVDEHDSKRVASPQSMAMDRTPVGAVAETSTYLESVAPPSTICMSFLATSAGLHAASDKEEGKRRSPIATLPITSTSSATPSVATIEPVLHSAVFPIRLTPTPSANGWRHFVTEDVPKDCDTQEDDTVSAMVNTLVPRSRQKKFSFKSQSCHILNQHDDTTTRVLREAPPLRRTISMTTVGATSSPSSGIRVAKKKKAW